MKNFYNQSTFGHQNLKIKLLIYLINEIKSNSNNKKLNISNLW